MIRPPIYNDNKCLCVGLSRSVCVSGAANVVACVSGEFTGGGRQTLQLPLSEAPWDEEKEGTRRSRETLLGRGRNQAKATASDRESKRTRQRMR